jgi:hypothetical protein
MVLDSQGRLDIDRSFRRLDYFRVLSSQTSRNNVQSEVSNQPIDFLAMRIPPDIFSDQKFRITDAIWLYGDETKQAVVAAGSNDSGQLLFRYIPVSSLAQRSDGKIQFEPAALRSDLPLRFAEDPEFGVSPARRAAWLADWHTDREWLQATHLAVYSNPMAAIYEQFAASGERCTAPSEPLCQYESERRRLVQPDLMVFANDHWNFNVRNFNPGGNHGSLLRPSMHSVLMFWGGSETGIPAGKTISEPYDALSFAPTVLKLLQQPDESLPGRLVDWGVAKSTAGGSEPANSTDRIR